MKMTLMAAIAAFSLLSAAARAEGGEGNGDPFVFRAPGIVTTFAPLAVARSQPKAPVQATAEALRSSGLPRPM